MNQGGLDVIAKASALWVGAMEITADEAQSELLRQLRGRVRITNRAEQVAVGGAAIALQESIPGSLLGVRRIAVRLDNHRPKGRNPTQALV